MLAGNPVQPSCSTLPDFEYGNHSLPLSPKFREKRGLVDLRLGLFGLLVDTHCGHAPIAKLLSHVGT